MSDAVDRGITVTEMAPMDKPIDAFCDTTAAFVGRALRGPLNEPVLIASVGEFRRRFGNVWSRSSLGPAVRQFFEHGGKNLYVVRVANNARGALVCLPARGSALVLRALEPGSTERIRAAIDYDGIDANNDELFNLTLQRIDPDTGLVADQELYQYASFCEGSDNFIGDLMLTSSLARVEGPLPTHRPEATIRQSASFDAGYVQHTQDGTDGDELSDYDLVGSRADSTGLFALQQVDQFDLLYLPPPGKDCDLGPASILAAERFCLERCAMLIIDPRTAWVTASDAITGIREFGYASPNMLSYFPRAHHRYDKDTSPRAVGAAIAGLFCKLDRSNGAWQTLDQHGFALNRNLVPAADFDEDSTETLTRNGFNVVRKGPAGTGRLTGNVTLGRGSESHREFTSLSVRRMSLQIVNAIRRATRWAVFEPLDLRLAERIQGQVSAYLGQLADMGAFEDGRFCVRCDAGPSQRVDVRQHSVTILIAFQPVGCQDPVSFALHQTVEGCRVASTAFAPADMH